MLKDLLMQKEYKSLKYYNPDKIKEFELLFDYGDIINLFDEMKDDSGKIPTQNDYINEGLKRAKKFLGGQEIYIYQIKQKHLFNWNEQLIANVKDRLARTYQSRLIEESVLDYLKQRDDLKCITDPLIDLKFGVDLVVLNNDRLFYIHVMSRFAEAYFREKSDRRSYVLKDGVKIYWKRNWGKAHVALTYTYDVDKKMEFVNGNYIFRKEYLDEYFDDLLGSDNYDDKDNSEFREFFNWVVQNRIPFDILEKLRERGENNG